MRPSSAWPRIGPRSSSYRSGDRYRGRTAVGVLCQGVCLDRVQASDAPPVFPLLLVGDEGKHRFHNYTLPLRKRLWPRRSHFVRQLPVNPIRMAVAELLASLAFRWALLHEQAHWLAGHLDYRSAQARESRRLSLREVRRVAGASSAENEAEDLCFEFQADSLATQLLFLSGLADDWAQCAPIGIRYVNRLKVYGATGASFFLDPARRLSRFRALLLAACVACLWFEVTRKNLRVV